MEYIWSNDGRFLSYQDGVISILSIARTKYYIKQDLMLFQKQKQSQQQRHLVQKSTNKSTPNTKHTQKDASTKKKKKQRMKHRQRRRYENKNTLLNDHTTNNNSNTSSFPLPPQRLMSFGQTTDGMMYGDV